MQILGEKSNAVFIICVLEEEALVKMVVWFYHHFTPLLIIALPAFQQPFLISLTNIY